MLRLVAFRILALLAVTVSAALLVDYVRPVPAFCGFRAGCDQVVNSAYGRVAGVPLPAIGLLAFGTFYSLTFSGSDRLRKLLGPVAIVAGLAGVGLVLLQKFVLQQMCPFCLIVDVAAILIAAVELGFPEATRNTEHPDPNIRAESHTEGLRPAARPLVRLGIIGLPLLLCIAGPFVWSAMKPSPKPPEQVKALQASGTNTIVEITDFGCSHCRAAHPVVEAFRKQHPDIVWKRIVVPMKDAASGHLAARAWKAAERQGKSDAMADALFELKDITEADCRAIAEKIGLDVGQFDADFGDTQIQDELTQTAVWVKAAEAQGLPQVWIQDVVVIGEPTESGLKSALRRAAGRQPSE